METQQLFVLTSCTAKSQNREMFSLLIFPSFVMNPTYVICSQWLSRESSTPNLQISSSCCLSVWTVFVLVAVESVCFLSAIIELSCACQVPSARRLCKQFNVGNVVLLYVAVWCFLFNGACLWVGIQLTEPAGLRLEIKKNVSIKQFMALDIMAFQVNSESSESWWSCHLVCSGHKTWLF